MLSIDIYHYQRTIDMTKIHRHAWMIDWLSLSGLLWVHQLFPGRMAETHPGSPLPQDSLPPCISFCDYAGEIS